MNCNLSELVSMIALTTPQRNRFEMMQFVSTQNEDSTRHVYISHKNCNASSESMGKMKSNANQLLETLDEQLKCITASIENGCSVNFHMGNTNTTYSKDKKKKICLLDFPNNDSDKSLKNFIRIMTLLNDFKENVSKKKISTIRDIYYRNVAIYDKFQTVCSRWIDILSTCLQVDRYELGIVASQKGLFYYGGSLKVECLSNGADDLNPSMMMMMMLKDCKTYTGSNLIPHCFQNFKFCKVSSMLETGKNNNNNIPNVIEGIAILEKDAIFKDLIFNSTCMKTNNWLLITGRGNPDYLTQNFIKYMSIQENIRIKKIHIFVDSDPYGINIAYNYYRLLHTQDSVVNGQCKISFQGAHLFDLLHTIATSTLGVFEQIDCHSSGNLIVNNNPFQLLPLSKRDFKMCHSFLNKITSLKEHHSDTVLQSLSAELQRQMVFRSKGEINTVQGNNFTPWFESKLT